jgi:hypothetical protein
MAPSSVGASLVAVGPPRTTLEPMVTRQWKALLLHTWLLQAPQPGVCPSLGRISCSTFGMSSGITSLVSSLVCAPSGLSSLGSRFLRHSPGS